MIIIYLIGCLLSFMLGCKVILDEICKITVYDLIVLIFISTTSYVGFITFITNMKNFPVSLDKVIYKKK